MSFQAPLVLVGLIALPLLAVFYVRHERAGRRARADYVAPALLPALTPRRPGWRRHAPLAAYALGLAAAIVAVARPQRTEAVPVEQASVVIATDRSGSMQSTDVAPSRLTAARDAGEAFVQAVPRDVRIGAIAFNQEATVLQSPTRDHEAVAASLRTVTAAGSTATGDALKSALRLIATARLDSPKAPAAIVLLSDGVSVRGTNPVEVAAAAAKAKVPVYTVALGTQGGTIVDKNGKTQAVPPDANTLRQIAEKTGGQSFAISDAKELSQVYKKLGSQVAKEDRPVQVTGLVAGTALLLLLMGAVSSLRWFGRVL